MNTVGFPLDSAATSAFIRTNADITSSTKTISDMTTANFEMTYFALQFQSTGANAASRATLTM
tara:strand:+ start:72 stop:260 length:189 start_codon:yes stop_codon:yes gene_type:complete